MSTTRSRNRDWYKTPAGADCNWCYGAEYEPSGADDAEMTLCRGHLAEYEGTSLDGLDREDAAHAADMAERHTLLACGGNCREHGGEDCW